MQESYVVPKTHSDISGSDNKLIKSLSFSSYISTITNPFQKKYLTPKPFFLFIYLIYFFSAKIWLASLNFLSSFSFCTLVTVGKRATRSRNPRLTHTIHRRYMMDNWAHIQSILAFPPSFPESDFNINM